MPCANVQAINSYVLVVNDSLVMKNIDKELLKQLYLKKIKTVDSSVSVGKIEISGILSGEVRQDFISEVLGRNESTLSAYWARMMFTGRATPPRLFENSEETLQYVAATPNAIAYVPVVTSLIDGLHKVSIK